jgi:transcriptional regulator with XRE-family HTH domain
MQSDLAKLFARRLQEEMDARQLSANALAKLAGVGQRSISRILLPEGHKDRQTPSLDIVDSLARALGLPPTWLLEAVGITSSRQQKVVSLPTRYPPVFAAQQQTKNYRSAKKKRE